MLNMEAPEVREKPALVMAALIFEASFPCSD